MALSSLPLSAQDSDKEAVQKIQNYVLNGKLRNFNHFFGPGKVLDYFKWDIPC